MTTLVLTGYTDEYAPIGEITAPRWRDYAGRHGYQFKLVRDYPPEKGHPCMQRLRHIVEALPSCDVLFCVGADCLCTNPATPLPPLPPPFDIAASLDWMDCATCVSTDALLVHNTPTMLDLFKCAYALPPVEATGGYDLRALDAMFRSDAKYSSRLLTLPRRQFQAVPRECEWPQNIQPWEPGDFIMHVTGLALDKRVAILTKYQNQ